MTSKLVSLEGCEFAFIKILKLPNELKQSFGHDRKVKWLIVISIYRIDENHPTIKQLTAYLFQFFHHPANRQAHYVIKIAFY